jgi:hypothetical protein
MLALAISFLAQGRLPNPLTSSTKDARLDSLVESRFSSFELKPSLNVSAGSTVIAVPLVQSPVDDMKQLEARWTTIGGLYVPSGSYRLKLAPGAYRVEVKKVEGNWKVRFTDEKGKIGGEVNADVESSPAARVPFCTDEHSVCYRFDRTKVCV